MKATIRKNGAADGAASDTPSGAIVGAAMKTRTVIDALGRSITVRKFSPLQKMKFAEVIGPAASQNERYVGFAALAAAVIEIDGEKIGFPASKRELEAMVQRLDEEGFEAIGPAIAELAGITVDADGNVITKASTGSAAKN